MATRFRASVGAAAVVLLGLGAVPGWAASYVVRDIGDLGGGMCIPQAMNGVGHIAGLSLTSTGALQFFIYDPATQHRIALPWTSNGSAWGVSGAMVGLSEYGHFVAGFQAAVTYTTVHAFEWTPKSNNALAGLSVELPTIRGFDWNVNAWASGVNSAGTVAGSSATAVGAGGTPQAVIWSKSSKLPLVLPVLNTSLPSGAAAISDYGNAVGYSNYSTGLPVAMLWTAQGRGSNLGTLAGGTWSNALAIDPTTGTIVVGVSGTKSGASHAFSYTAPGPMIDLGVLPGASAASANTAALAVRVEQGAVGQATNANGVGVAVLFKAGAVTDLNTVLANAPSGLRLDFAIGIDSTGRILAHGVSAQGQDRCILLSP